MECCEKKEKKISEVAPSQGNNLNLALGGLAILLIGILIFNQMTINNLSAKLDNLNTAQIVKTTGQTAQATSGSTTTASFSQDDVWSEIAPKGTPAVYGNELGVSYDAPEAGISKMAAFDDYGGTPINLAGEKLQRYITITTAISCEYCCGAKAITSASGAPACGCAHSGAMRGLAKYLLDKHPDMSDDQILEELGKWKVPYFPQDSVKKAVALKSNNLPIDYISISSNKYRGLKTASAAGTALPGQVGGC